MAEKVPDWLFKMHCCNYGDLLSCKNNPSINENRVALHFYNKILPNSGFGDFKYIALNEWMVDKERPLLGKGDLVLTNGKNLLVVEIKVIRNTSHQMRLKCLLKVIRQARYYTMIIQRFRDYNLFPDQRMNFFFKTAKVHAAFYTNLDQKLILLNRINDATNGIMRDKQLHLREGITVEDVYKYNTLSVHDIIDQSSPEDSYEEDELDFLNFPKPINGHSSEINLSAIINLIPEEHLNRIGVDNLEEFIFSSEEEEDDDDAIKLSKDQQSDDVILLGDIKKFEPSVAIIDKNQVGDIFIRSKDRKSKNRRSFLAKNDFREMSLIERNRFPLKEISIDTLASAQRRRQMSSQKDNFRSSRYERSNSSVPQSYQSLQCDQSFNHFSQQQKFKPCSTLTNINYSKRDFFTPSWFQNHERKVSSYLFNDANKDCQEYSKEYSNYFKENSRNYRDPHKQISFFDLSNKIEKNSPALKRIDASEFLDNKENHQKQKTENSLINEEDLMKFIKQSIEQNKENKQMKSRYHLISLREKRSLDQPIKLKKLINKSQQKKNGSSCQQSSSQYLGMKKQIKLEIQKREDKNNSKNKSKGTQDQDKKRKMKSIQDNIINISQNDSFCKQNQAKSHFNYSYLKNILKRKIKIIKKKISKNKGIDCKIIPQLNLSSSQEQQQISESSFQNCKNPNEILKGKKLRIKKLSEISGEKEKTN